MPNVKQQISAHNKLLLQQSTANEDENERRCNCGAGENKCPLEGECLAKSVIYQATVKTERNTRETYVGITAGKVKNRYTNHMSSFRNENQRTVTSLTQFIWSLIDVGERYDVTWNMIKKARPYFTTNKQCNLCLAEKHNIFCNNCLGTLNTRHLLISACWHKIKH